LFRKLDTFHGESSFYTWSHLLVVNVVLMQLRKKRGLKELPLKERSDSDSQGSVSPSQIPIPDTELLGCIDKVSLQRALEHLPRGFRVAFVLHDIEGYKHHEISKMMACSVACSKSQLHRARLRLRKLLRGARADRRPAKQLRCGQTLRTGRNVPASLPRENLSVVDVRGYGPKKSATGLVWQQSCAARGHAECLIVIHIRFRICKIVVNINLEL
jgi:RNA polymerase sigma factor (sigma-70 family)